MSNFPRGGDVAATRDWLDKEGFAGLFIGWNADSVLGQEKMDMISLVGNEAEGRRLWGLLRIARESPQPQARPVVIFDFGSEGGKVAFEDFTRGLMEDMREAIRAGVRQVLSASRRGPSGASSASGASDASDASGASGPSGASGASGASAENATVVDSNAKGGSNVTADVGAEGK